MKNKLVFVPDFIQRAAVRRFKQKQQEQIETALHTLECIGEICGYAIDRYKDPDTGKMVLVVNDSEWAAKLNAWLSEQGIFAK